MPCLNRERDSSKITANATRAEDRGIPANSIPGAAHESISSEVVTWSLSGLLPNGTSLLE